METDYCKKCGTYTIVEKHHVLPKSIFGGIGPVINLCPTCHRKYHLHIGQKNLKNDDPDYHQYTFWKWMIKGAFIFLIILTLTYLF